MAWGAPTERTGSGDNRLSLSQLLCLLDFPKAIVIQKEKENNTPKGGGTKEKPVCD